MKLHPDFLDSLEALAEEAVLEAEDAITVYEAQLAAMSAPNTPGGANDPFMRAEVGVHLEALRNAILAQVFRVRDAAAVWDSSWRWTAEMLASTRLNPFGIGSVWMPGGSLSPEKSAMSKAVIAQATAALVDSVDRLEARLASAQASASIPVEEPSNLVGLLGAAGLVALALYALSSP